MARITAVGLDGLMADLSAVAALPDPVAEEMLQAEANIIVKAQKDVGMRMRVHQTGVTLGAIKSTKMKRAKRGRVVDVYPQGKNKHGDKNAMVAFLTEYGVSKRKIPPRPFIRTANEEATPAAIEAATAVYDRFLKSKKL